VQLNSNEKIIKKGRANHLRKIEWVGGKLFLTNQKLIFKPHQLNIQTYEVVIPLDEIVSVEAKHSDFISRELRVLLKNNSVEKFYVYGRKSWLQEVKKVISEYRKQS